MHVIKLRKVLKNVSSNVNPKCQKGVKKSENIHNEMQKSESDQVTDCNNS